MIFSKGVVAVVLGPEGKYSNKARLTMIQKSIGSLVGLWTPTNLVARGVGAGGGSRTPTGFPLLDFETVSPTA